MDVLFRSISCCKWSFVLCQIWLDCQIILSLKCRISIVKISVTFRLVFASMNWNETYSFVLRPSRRYFVIIDQCFLRVTVTAFSIISVCGKLRRKLFYCFISCLYSVRIVHCKFCFKTCKLLRSSGTFTAILLKSLWDAAVLCEVYCQTVIICFLILLKISHFPYFWICSFSSFC